MEQFPIPYVLKCIHFLSPCPDENRRTIRDYEFDLYLSGEREVFLDGEHYRLTAGSLIFRRPGQKIVGYGGYDTYMLTLDFRGTPPTGATEYFRVSHSPQQPDCDFALLDSLPPVFFPTHLQELKEIYQKLAQCSYPNIVDLPTQRACITEFLLLVLADAYRFHREQAQKNGDTASYVKKACAYVQEHYPSPLSVEGIAAELSLNPNYLIRLFKSEIGITPARYILDTRLLRARDQLLQTERSVQEIALSVGFSNTSYFIKRFHQRFGDSPRNYRRINGG